MADLSTGTNFDPVARYYDRLAHLVFGNTLLHARLHFLSQIPKGAQVLVVGGGTGAILPALFNQIGETGSVYYLEYSEKMIEQAQVRMSGTAANMVWKRGTVADLPSDLQVEVIITNFFLDLFPFEEGQLQAHQLVRCLKPRGGWILTDFFEPKPGLSKRLGQILITLMYGFFRLLCRLKTRKLANVAATLPPEMKLAAQQSYWRGFIQSRWYVQDQ